MNVLIGFLIRWATELTGIFTILTSAYFFATPEQQAAVQAILTGQGGQLSLNTYIGLVIYGFGRLAAFRATVTPQVVTSEGVKILPKVDSVAMERIDLQAKAAPQRSTLWETLLAKLTGK